MPRGRRGFSSHESDTVHATGEGGGGEEESAADSADGSSSTETTSSGERVAAAASSACAWVSGTADTGLKKASRAERRKETGEPEMLPLEAPSREEPAGDTSPACTSMGRGLPHRCTAAGEEERGGVRGCERDRESESEREGMRVTEREAEPAERGRREIERGSEGPEETKAVEDEGVLEGSEGERGEDGYASCRRKVRPGEA